MNHPSVFNIDSELAIALPESCSLGVEFPADQELANLHCQSMELEAKSPAQIAQFVQWTDKIPQPQS